MWKAGHVLSARHMVTVALMATRKCPPCVASRHKWLSQPQLVWRLRLQEGSLALNNVYTGMPPGRVQLKRERESEVIGSLAIGCPLSPNVAFKKSSGVSCALWAGKLQWLALLHSDFVPRHFYVSHTKSRPSPFMSSAGSLSACLSTLLPPTPNKTHWFFLRFALFQIRSLKWKWP
jgi:hypothetical protein